MDSTLNGLYFFFAVLLGAILGGIVYRWRGGGEPVGWGKYMPRPVDQILFSLPYIALAFYVLPSWSAGILSLITVAFVSKGHGRNMDLGTFDNNSRPEGVKPEWYEGLIDGHTSWGEFLTGFFLWAGAIAVGWFIVL